MMISKSLLIILFFLAIFILQKGEGNIGVCNGRLGNNLPSEHEVVNFYKINGIRRMRIYDPNPITLKALQGSQIDLILDVPNADLHSLQSDAMNWVQTNILPYFPATGIRYLAVGNEVNPENPETSRFVPLVLPAMQSLHRSLSVLGLQEQIKISTATYSGIVDNSFPPSNAIFRHPSFMVPIVQFLEQTGSPLLANIYPYFSHINNTVEVPLPYALFTATGVVVHDGVNGYLNLFDAMVDAMYYATEKAGGTNVRLVVSESGWPSSGGVSATVENANMYYQNLINHVRNGTPKRPGIPLETYLFAIFDENQKPGAATEQHFGLFYPNLQMKFPLQFTIV